MVRPGLQRLVQPLEQRENMGTPLAGGLIEIRCEDEAPRCAVARGIGSQPGRPLREERSGLGRTSEIEASRRPLQLGRDLLVGDVGGPCQVHRPLVGIVEHRGEHRVNRPTFAVGVHVDERRREERVREPQRPRAHIDDARLAKLVDAWPSDCAIEAPERRRGQAGLAGRSRERRQTCAQRGCEIACDARAAVLDRGELERVVGASKRELDEPLELKWRRDLSGPGRDQPRELLLAEPFDLDAHDRPRVTGDEPEQLLLELGADGRDDSDRLLVQPAQREPERSTARRVDPLCVVDCHHDGRRGGE